MIRKLGPTKLSFNKWILAAAMALPLAGVSNKPIRAQDRADVNQQVASVEQLKTEALRTLKTGEFDKTSELIARAASISHDPTLQQMRDWVGAFQQQQQQFAAERHKQYDKAVADVKKLVDNRKEGYALDSAARAFTLTDDKEAFRKEAWVDQLVASATKLATDYESSEQWIRALRVYSDLTQIEPANPEWKDRLKLATRRARLLSLYTPDSFRAMLETEVKEREAADQVLNPTTQPTTKPSKDKDDNDAFKTDWHDSLRGVQMPMLKTALIEAKSNYWKDVDFKTLMTGGLKGLQAVATTRGLETTFPSLGDEPRRRAFLDAINQQLDTVKNTPRSSDQRLLSSTLDAVEQANRKTLNLPDEVIVSEFADGGFAELDPFSSMIWPSEVEEFNKSTQGEFYGVGVQIQMDEDGGLKVVSPLEDSPAWRQGIRAGDTITKINGKNAKGITINQAVKTITGPEGTNVCLTVRSVTKSGPSEKDFDIKRERIKVASLKGWRREPGGAWDYFIDPQQKIGYLRLTNFTKTSSDDLDRSVADMRKQGARAVILDLRDNPGGLLTAATEVADKFLKDGTIVSTKTDPSRDGPVQPPLVASASADDCNLPLVVLVNQYSASASEIVSGALKDWKRAMIVGERTFGKGSVQMLFPLRDRTAYLKLTTSHYYLPLGRCIHREENSTAWGVDPDVTVEMTPEQKREAINVRQRMDILRDAGATDDDDSVVDAKEEANAIAAGPSTAPTTKPTKKDLLAVDPQLSAALLLLRLQLAGGTM